jgi:hypothetical protein
MVHHPQGQPRLRWIIPVQVDRLKAGVGHRPRRLQRPATARAGVRVVGLFGIRLEHLRAADPRRPTLFARFPSRFGLRRFGLRRFGLRRVRRRRVRRRLRLAVVVRRRGVGLRVSVRLPLAAVLALPRRPTARRPRAVLRSLVQAVPSLLEIRQQPHRQPAQRLHLQGLEVGVVDLAEAMGAQVHGGRSRGWAIVFHTRLVRGSQPLLGGGVNGYIFTLLPLNLHHFGGLYPKLMAGGRMTNHAK